MNNREISAALEQVADLLEFQGANPFRVRAYRGGARAVHDLPRSVEQILAGAPVEEKGRRLTEIGGIGKDLAEKIATLVATGQLPLLAELRSQVPTSVMAILRVPGLGPKKAASLFHQLNVTSLDELREACHSHRVRQLKGFGAKTEEVILRGLDIAAAADARMYWAEADEYAQALKDHLRRCEGVRKMELAGSYRRGRDTVGDLDVLVECDDVEKTMDHFGRFDDAAEVLARGGTKMSIRLGTGLQIDLRAVGAESFGAALQYFTGSKDHNVVLRGMAKDRGLKINEYGVFRGDEYIAGRTEEEVYAALDLPCFSPELREARREFDWAAVGELPELVTLEDIRADLHMHTTDTDGKADLESMVEAARQRGLQYIAITDHSKRVTMARGLDARRLRKQWARIDALNQRLEGFIVLKGIEVDILERGGLDLEDDVLAEADWVVASVHYGQNQPREQITTRIVDALANPHVSAIAHPTGRLINRREPYEVDLDRVFAAAREHDKLLELNANPARLDLDDVACAGAKSHGVRIVISSDAHSPDGLDVMRYGILQARRAGLTKDDVANTLGWKQMQKLIGR